MADVRGVPLADVLRDARLKRIEKFGCAVLGAVDGLVVRLIRIAKVGRGIDDVHVDVLLARVVECFGDQRGGGAVRRSREQREIGAVFDRVEPARRSRQRTRHRKRCDRLANVAAMGSPLRLSDTAAANCRVGMCCNQAQQLTADVAARAQDDGLDFALMRPPSVEQIGNEIAQCDTV